MKKAYRTHRRNKQCTIGVPEEETEKGQKACLKK